jgi:hypothetical protein
MFVAVLVYDPRRTPPDDRFESGGVSCLLDNPGGSPTERLLSKLGVAECGRIRVSPIV